MNEFDLLSTAIGPGLTVIEASAGTGKTWSIAHLVPRLILDGTVERLDQVLLVSFTEDATRELAERVRAVLAALVQVLLDQDARPDQVEDLAALLEGAHAAASGAVGIRTLLRALQAQPADVQRRRLRNLLAARLDADRLVVGTIHALCRRVLSDEGFLAGMPSGFEVMPDVSEPRRESLSDVWRQDLANDPLLAQVAVHRGWSLAADAAAWSLLDPVDSERLYPAPLSLAQARAALVDGLRAMRAAVGDLGTIAEVLKTPQVTPTKVGKAADFQAMPGLLEGVVPGAPGRDALALAEALAQAGTWIFWNGAANNEARARVVALPLVRAAVRAAQALSDLEWAWRGHALSAGRARLDRALKAANSLSYNDLIGRLDGALQGPRGAELAGRMRRRWKRALVDESQDTDRRQLAIFEAVFNPTGELDASLVLIGDPKQSVYGFRGADLAAYEGARDRPGVPLHRLTVTHRSADGLVRCLNALFDQADPLGSPALAVPPAEAARSDAQLPLPVGERHRLVAALVPEEERREWQRSSERLRRSAAAAAAALARLLGRAVPVGEGERPAERRVLPGDCAVLTRSNHQAQAVREALADLGIPAVVRGDGDVLVSEAAAELCAVLRAALQPGHRGLRRLALAGRLLGLDAGQLDALSEREEEDWQLKLEAWGKAWKDFGVAALLSLLGSEAGVPLRLARLPQGERLLTDLAHLGELLQAEEAGRRLAPDRLMQWMQAAMAEAGRSGRPSALRLQRLETDASAVQVVTVHRAKGLEYDYCFLPFLWDAKAPSDKKPRVVRGEDGLDALADLERLPDGERARIQAESRWRSLEEELRLAYVALTRARRQVWFLAGWIGYAAGNSKIEPSALDWLLREPRAGETGGAWYARMQEQKRVPTEAETKKGLERAFHCEHAERLRRLSARQPLIGVQPPDFGGVDWRPEALPGGALEAEPAPGVPSGWRVTSFSGLAGEGGGLFGRYDPDSEDAGSKGDPLPLADLKGGSLLGDCLHAMLEQWDFNPLNLAPVGPTLRSHGMDKPLPDGRDPRLLLETELPRWAEARLPGYRSLAQAAADRRLSEWHFILPLGEGGISGPMLARVFVRHSDARLRDYAAHLAGLSPQAVHGMLQGYIDRLVHAEGAWGVVDWKSNTLGRHASDYSRERMLGEAVQHHYLLQLHLYLLALRRHLVRRGQPFTLTGASLVYLRALEPGTDKGILHFPPDGDFLDGLEALFAGAAV